MFIGKNKSTGIMTDIRDALLTTGKSYLCPVCGEELIIKNGSVITPHFAHKVGYDCDTFTHEMSAWHKWWQELFPLQNREHVEELKISVKEYKKCAKLYNFEKSAIKQLIKGYKKDDFITLRHRADVRACGYVIEFQNSPISRDEFNERNWFYQAIGCKVIWIFNMIDLWKTNQIKSVRCLNSTYSDCVYRWKYASKMFTDFIPQCYFFSNGCEYYNVSRDNRNIIVFFQTYQFSEKIKQYKILKQVIWAKYDDGKTSFSELAFHADSKSPQEFFKAVLSKQI